MKNDFTIVRIVHIKIRKNNSVGFNVVFLTIILNQLFKGLLQIERSDYYTKNLLILNI